MYLPLHGLKLQNVLHSLCGQYKQAQASITVLRLSSMSPGTAWLETYVCMLNNAQCLQW